MCRVSDPLVQQTTADCLESLQCCIDPKTFLCAYVVALFPGRVPGSLMLFKAAHPMLGLFECAVGGVHFPESRTSLVNAVSAYAAAFDLWRDTCFERSGFWVEMCDSLRLVVDYVVYIR